MFVYLDTNVYISANYIFDTDNMGRLNKLIEAGEVTLLYTSATMGEVEQHLAEDISAAVQKYNRVLRKEMPALKSADSYMLKELNIQEVVDAVKIKAKAFFEQENSQSISLNPLNGELLLRDYFEGRAPFEKKKPNEFKDAIMINAVKNYQKEIGEIVYIVSNDEGFRKAFDGNEKFICFEFLSGFLKFYNKQQEKLSKITECITDALENADFEEVIKDYLRNLDVYRGYYGQWEYDDIDIDEVCGELIYIEEKDGQWGATISADVELSIDITYRDEDNSYYDREEGAYLIENYIHALEKHLIAVELFLLCEVENNEEDGYEIIDVEVSKENSIKTLDIDEDTLIDSEEIDTRLKEEPNLEYCSQCGKLLGRTTNGAYFDYFDNPLCDECMQVDEEGDICPMCGKKVPYEFMMSEFCRDCAWEVD